MDKKFVVHKAVLRKAIVSADPYKPVALINAKGWPFQWTGKFIGNLEGEYDELHDTAWRNGLKLYTLTEQGWMLFVPPAKPVASARELNARYGELDAPQKKVTYEEEEDETPTPEV